MEDMDFSFADEEDFGLAKSFSAAPVTMITPDISHDNFTNMSKPEQFNMEDDSIKAEGFNFKFAPVENVSLPMSLLSDEINQLLYVLASAIPAPTQDNGSKDD